MPEQVAPKPRHGLGIFLIIFPFVALFLILMAYAVTQFVTNELIGASPEAINGLSQPYSYDSTTGLGVQDPRETIANVIKIALSFLGILAILSIFVCVPIGIIFLARRPIYAEGEYDPRSGKGDQSIVPEEIRGWNWGAAGLGWIWGVSHRLWISFLTWVPFVNIVFWIILAIKGNEWAWRKNQWKSVADFQAVQRKWMPWGIVFFILNILGILAAFIAE